MYDPNCNSWENLPNPNVGVGTQLVSINNKLWAVGGAITLEKILEFDIIKNTWNHVLDMNVARIHHRAIVVNY